ncbi:alpha/beta hydrolase [Desulfobacter hydrogenophilus]|uniref:Alpha/beta hydrolase n=1 Tax=Desulfobacter hydrogenophilus TaxID=2291 RepID=A0A328FIN1_9BACT|nr:alpha/beta fold hydrolase [Desulfobacter hydrogenophilus]NDY71190.1 alpha/beta hydrolase [Desulfobacter hydrogenophilus]QBH14211.1 alpha/beta hydrolase [Desulfobacter hydrogenophilus]RAM02857.1 alpha/beta hydrolase [Desulfobacter hydrogenophilus]
MILLVSLAVVAAIVFLSGPRVRIDQTIFPKKLPLDIDDYLILQEQQFSDMIPGIQKTVVWAGTPNEQTEFSVVYIHGFSATRKETAPLSDFVAQALGANLFYTRLTGHGRTGGALADASVNDWLNDVVEAYEIGQRLGSKVIMVGCSTGGTSLAWLAHRAATMGGMDALYACIFLSPNFRPKNSFSTMLTWPWGRQIAGIIIGKERGVVPENQGHGQYWITRYPVAALLSMMGMVRLVRGLDLSKIRVPCLVIYSPQDQIVHIPSLELAFKRMGCLKKQLVPFTGSADPGQHILAGDIFSPGTSEELADMIVSFVLESDLESV